MLAFWENEGRVGVTGLETTGVSIEGVTDLDDLVFLCEGEEKVSDPISKGFKFSEDDWLSATLVEDDD